MIQTNHRSPGILWIADISCTGEAVDGKTLIARVVEVLSRRVNKKHQLKIF